MRPGLTNAMKSLLRPVVSPIWRRVWARLETRIAPVESRLAESERRLAGFERRLAESEQAWDRHLPSFLNAAGTVGAFGHRLAAQARQIEADSSRVARLWERLEALHEETTPGAEARIVARDKVAAAMASENLRLNLGPVALPGYVNVGPCERPGVDIVGGADALPFEPGTVGEIVSAGPVEQASQEALRRRLLPHWAALLKPGGTLRAVVPDAAALLRAAAAGDYPFEEFRQALLGAQDDGEGRHRNLLTPESLAALFEEAGFADVAVPVAGRRSGRGYTFEIVGRRP